MALKIKACWEALVEAATATGLFKDVRAMSVNRVNDAEFLKTFPGLQFPACLIVLLDGRNDVRGQASDRSRHWNAIIVDEDPAGEAWQKVVDLIDSFISTEDGILDQQLLDDELTVLGSCDIAVAFTVPRFSVYQVSFTTEEAAAR